MSDTQVGRDWWQASDGRWFPPEDHPGFVDMNGRRFRPDPTGRHAFRQVLDGRWTARVASSRKYRAQSNDVEGEALAQSHPAPPLVGGESPAAAAKARDAGGTASLLEAAGWVTAALGLLAGLLTTATLASDYSSSTSPVLGLVIGVVGLVQGLVLIGFGKMVGYLASIAASTERAADLINESLNG